MTQLPSPPARRSPVPQHAKRLRPKTYSVAVYLVIGVVVLQVIMVISVFWLRAMVVPVNVHLPKAVASQVVTPPSLPPTLIGPPSPPPGVKAAKPEPPRLPGLIMTPTRPALLSVPAISDKLEQIGNLNEQAETLMRQNAYEQAAEILIKAEDIDPCNPSTLKNLAETSSLMNDPMRAKIYWQRLVDIGPAVGTVYAVAKDHVLLLSSTHDADILREASSLPRMIYVDNVEKTPIETRNGDAQFRLRAVLMRKDPKMPALDQKKLQPFVIFYQRMPDGTLTPDLGQHKGSFDDTFLFWGSKNAEPFAVEYVMPIPGTPGPNNSTQGEYYGFVIGIYYNKVLQDVRSEPSDLIARMPLPEEIE